MRGKGINEKEQRDPLVRAYLAILVDDDGFVIPALRKRAALLRAAISKRGMRALVDDGKESV